MDIAFLFWSILLFVVAYGSGGTTSTQQAPRWKGLLIFGTAASSAASIIMLYSIVKYSESSLQ